MCIIVVRPHGVKTPDMKTFQQCWNRNRDGGGLMWLDAAGKLKVVKGLMTWPAMKKAIRKIPEGVDAAYHFRIGTNGSNTAENTHPWPMEDQQAALMHNGIIRFLADDKDISDSKRLSELMNNHGMNVVLDEEYQVLIQSAIGFGNKVVLLNEYGFAIINEKEGNWKDGCWYSNTGHIIYPVVQSYVPISRENSIFNNHQYEHYDFDNELTPPAQDTIVPVVFKSVIYDILSGKAQMTSESGLISQIPIDIFISNYDDFEYSKECKASLDAMVAQWAIMRDRERPKLPLTKK